MACRLMAPSHYLILCWLRILQHPYMCPMVLKNTVYFDIYWLQCSWYPTSQSDKCFNFPEFISMAQAMTAVSLLLMHWRYCIHALNHWCIPPEKLQYLTQSYLPFLNNGMWSVERYSKLWIVRHRQNMPWAQLCLLAWLCGARWRLYPPAPPPPTPIPAGVGVGGGGVYASQSNWQ